MIYQILFLLLLNSVTVIAQLALGDVSDDNAFEAKFELQVYGGASIPLGKYRLLTDVSNDRSAAAIGGYGAFSGSFTPMLSSPWRIGLILGHMHHSFQSKASEIYFSLSELKGSSWNSSYGLLGICFISQYKLYYSIGVYAGIVGYTGGNITSARAVLDTMEVQTWIYKTHLAGAVQATLSLGYHFTPKFSMFVNAAILHAAGLRKGSLLTEKFAINGQNILQQLILTEEKVSVQNQTTIFTLNIGIGFRYKFYEAPEKINYKFNLEENQ